jgi:hypothetical protein
MKNKPKLNDLVDALEMVSQTEFGECQAYLDKTSGEIFHVIDDELAAVEDGDLESVCGIVDEDPDNLDPNWRANQNLEQRHVSALKAIAADNDNEFICLPTSFDVNDYCKIITDWCELEEIEFIDDLNETESKGNDSNNVE